MSKTFNKNIPYTFSGAINLSTSAGLNITNNSNTIGSIITTGGNVGIGTASPNGRLQISSGTTTGNISIDALSGANDGFSYIGFNGYNNAAGNEVRINSNKLRWRLATDQRTTADNILIDAHNGTSFPYILRFQVGTQGNVKLNTAGEARYHLYNNAGVSEWLFGQKSSTRSDFTISKLVTSTETDYLTVTTGGNVGISTTSPIARFHLDTTPTAASYGIWNGSATLSANQQLLQFIGKDNALRNGFWNWYSHVGDNNTSNNLRWDVNGLNGIFSLSAAGRVGILTTNPAYNFDVNGTIRSTGDIFVGDGTNAEALNLWDVPGAAWQLASGSWNLNIRNGTVGSTMVDRVTVTSIGNVGIGVTNPLERLHVNGNIILGPSAADSNVDYSISTPGQLTINANNAGTQDNTFVALTLTAGVSSNQSNIILCGSASNSFRHIAFSTMNTERMRLSSAGNLGIGTSTPAYPLDIINTVGSSNQPFMRIGNSTGGAGNQVGIILAPFTPRTGGASSQIISIDDGNASAHLTLWTAPAGTGSASVERVRIQNNGNVGIGTASPAFTLDVNGTIARSGVKLPRYDNGSFSGATSFSIPILFNDTQYNYAEFRVRYVTSNVCNINISATSYVNAAMNFGECALTTVKWNAQGTPVYATFSGVTSGIFADTVEMVGIDNNLIFRIVRATGTSSTGLRNHYSYDNVYCWSGVGTARGYGQGHIDNASVGGSPLQFVTFTCSTGTISGTYSSVHYY